ncbi:MAG: DUF4384 domain-containing protein [Planctomycetia bacterium]
MFTSRVVAMLAVVGAGCGLAGCGDSGRAPAPTPEARDEAAAPGATPRERNIVRKKLSQDFKSIALEYTVLLVDDGGTQRAVDPAAHTFAVGDSFLVRIRPQDDLYVYVFNEGPGGQRTCLLPAADEPPHLVKSGADIVLPDDGGFFTFEPPAGEEKLVVVALPEPTDDVRVLAGAVFKAQADGLKSEEQAAVRKQADETLDALRAKSGAAVRTRGPVRKVVERLDAAIAAGTTVSHVEPPHDGETSTYGIAVVAADGSGPELVLDIPLRSRSAAADGR